MTAETEIVEFKDIKQFKFPVEIKELFNHLGNDNQWLILEMLIRCNNKMSYTELLKEISQTGEIAKGTFNYHLDQLEQGGLLRNWSEKGSDISVRDVSYYKISKFAMKVIAGTLRAMEKKYYVVDPYTEVKMLAIHNLPEMLELASGSIIAANDTIVYSPSDSFQGFARIPPIAALASGKKSESKENINQSAAS